MEWIYLAQDRQHCWDLFNTVIYLRFHIMWGISELAEELAAWKWGCLMDLDTL